MELAAGTCGFFFVADLHALTTLGDAEQTRALTYDVAAGWIALGLDPEVHALFRQSDLPEITLLSWILACHTNCGLLDRAHAFKAARAEGRPVNAGLYTYPVLMAADILGFRATEVPVGKDQKQHVEIARDIATAFNRRHGEQLTLPRAMITGDGAGVVGTDGRKMSKSYDNTIPILAPAKTIRRRVNTIVTDSAPYAEPKDPERSTIFAIYRRFASPDEREALAQRYRAGHFGWGDAKRALGDLLITRFAPARERYQQLLADRQRLDAIFAAGLHRCRPVLAEVLDTVRSAVGV